MYALRNDLAEGLLKTSHMFVTNTIARFEEVKSLHVILLVITLVLVLGFVTILLQPYVKRIHAESKAIAGESCSSQMMYQHSTIYRTCPDAARYHTAHKSQGNPLCRCRLPHHKQLWSCLLVASALPVVHGMLFDLTY
jgi:hypothetical protein